MFWRKKELTSEERTVIALQELDGWYDFIKTETDLTEADGENYVAELEMKVRHARRIEKALEISIQWLAPLTGGKEWKL